MSVGAEGVIPFMVRALDFQSYISPYSQMFMFTAECPVLHWPYGLRTYSDNISCRKLLGGQGTSNNLGSTYLLKKVLSLGSSRFSLVDSVVEHTRKGDKSSLAPALLKVADGSEKCS